MEQTLPAASSEHYCSWVVCVSIAWDLHAQAQAPFPGSGQFVLDSDQPRKSSEHTDLF